MKEREGEAERKEREREREKKGRGASGEVRRGIRREAEKGRVVAAPALTFLYATNPGGSFFLGG